MQLGSLFVLRYWEWELVNNFNKEEGEEDDSLLEYHMEVLFDCQLDEKIFYCDNIEKSACDVGRCRSIRGISNIYTTIVLVGTYLESCKNKKIVRL